MFDSSDTFDDRVVNGMGQPYGPILAKMLHDEVKSRLENKSHDRDDGFHRITAILGAAADYVDAIVEGKGPDAARVVRLETALRFYAENSNYDDGETVYDKVAPVMADNGEKARIALETKE